MTLVRENGKVILKNTDQTIEEYSFKENIDLKELIEFLLNANLSSKFELEDKLNEKSNEEENLVSFIKSLINDYNDKVDEYNKFVEEQKSSNI